MLVSLTILPDLLMPLTIIIIMEIFKVPTLLLKALNKHSITHTMYTEMGMLSAIKMHTGKKARKKS